MPSQRILYGVLNLLGLSALLLIPLDKLFRKVPAWAGLGGRLLLFALTKNVSRGSLGFEGWCSANCPAGCTSRTFLPWRGSPPPLFGARITFPCCPGSSCSAPGTSSGAPLPKRAGQGTAGARRAPPELSGPPQPHYLPGPPAGADGGSFWRWASWRVSLSPLHKNGHPLAGCPLSFPVAAFGAAGQRTVSRLMAQRIPLMEAMPMLLSMPTPKNVSSPRRSWI